MRIAFLGNHTVGVRALEAITREDEVVLVVTHPPDPGMVSVTNPCITSPPRTAGM